MVLAWLRITQLGEHGSGDEDGPFARERIAPLLGALGDVVADDQAEHAGPLLAVCCGLCVSGRLGPVSLKAAERALVGRGTPRGGDDGVTPMRLCSLGADARAADEFMEGGDDDATIVPEVPLEFARESLGEVRGGGVADPAAASGGGGGSAPPLSARGRRVWSGIALSLAHSVISVEDEEKGWRGLAELAVLAPASDAVRIAVDVIQARRRRREPAILRR